MTGEGAADTSLVFIYSDNAVLSSSSKRTARSHAAAVSRNRGTAAKARLKSQKDNRGAGGKSNKSDKSKVSDTDSDSLSPVMWRRHNGMKVPGSISPTTLLDTSLLDPFGSTVLPMNLKMSALLKGCSFFSGRRSYPLKSMTNAFNDWSLPLVLQDATLLRATMCMASAEMEIRRKTMPDGVGSPHGAENPLDGTMVVSDYTYFKLQALKHLNRALSNPDTGKRRAADICAIMFLLWAEFHCGNFRDIHAHLSGLQQAINATGGIDAFPLPVILTIMNVVYVCSAMAYTRPPLRPAVLSIDRLSEATRDAIKWSPDQKPNPLPKGFFTPANRRLLNPAILDTASSIYTYLRFRQLSCGHALKPSLEEVEYFFMRHCAVENDLLSMPFNEALTPLTPLQNAVRLTLFVFGFATYTRFEPSSAYTLAIVDQLKNQLQLVDISTMSKPDLLLWTLFFGAHISRHTQERAWFVVRLARCIEQLRLTNVDDVQKVLETFFFLGHFSRESLLEIWSETRSIEQTHSAKDNPIRATDAVVSLRNIPPSVKALSTGTEFLAWDPYPVRR